MKFSFFKRNTQKEQLKLHVAVLNQEKKELLDEIANLRLTKDAKINGLVKEISDLKAERKYYEEMFNCYKGMSKTDEETKEMLRNANEKSREKIQALENTNFALRLLIPEKFPVKEVMGKCADSAWCGGNAKRTFESADGKIKLFFEGTVYEPTWEYFTAGCCVYYIEDGMEKRKPLYTIGSRNVAAYRNETVETGSVEEVKRYLIEKNVSFKEV